MLPLSLHVLTHHDTDPAMVRVRLGSSSLQRVEHVQFCFQPCHLFSLPNPSSWALQKHTTGCKKHERSPDKAKKPKVKKEKKKEKKPPH